MNHENIAEFLLAGTADAFGTAGLAMLSAYHAIIMLQIVRSSGLIRRRTLLMLGMITVASFATTLINPYGAGLWKFMLDALRLPRPEIADWGPLEILSRDASGFWLLMVIAGLSVAQDRRRVVPAQLILLCLLLWQGVNHCRHLSILAIVCGFWIPRHLHSVIESVRNCLTRLQKPQPLRRRGMIGSVGSPLIQTCSCTSSMPMNQQSSLRPTNR